MTFTVPRRSLDELWALWKRHAYVGVYPFEFSDYDGVLRAFQRLKDYEHEAWAASFSAEAPLHEERGLQAEERGDFAAAKSHYLTAYAFYRLARFPVVSSPPKKAAYLKSRDLFLRAARFFDPPLERVSIPFAGHPGEGSEISGYLRLPKMDQPGPFPILLHWGGLDSFKEERNKFVEIFLERGLAVLSIDMPCTGDCPVVDPWSGERVFGAALDWIASDRRFDSTKIGGYGPSFGGYWAAKVAHVYADRFACVVNQGGCTHYAFERDWILQAASGEYAFDYLEGHAHTFGYSDCAEWLESAPKMSLLRSGILDGPCAPMLLVNGVKDSVFPIQDMYILLEHGRPKTARFYPNGHMGHTKDTMATIASWLTSYLRPL